MIETDNLIFSLNATMPVFFMMALGWFLRQKTRFLPDSFANQLNTFVFQIALPAQLFLNLSQSDFYAVWNGKIVIFCFVVSLLSILWMAALSLFVRDRSQRSEYIQAGYRSSQALLGAALMQNIYGQTGSLALILIGAVPLYNVAAVIILTMPKDGKYLDKQTLQKTFHGIITNPILISIAVGLLWSLLKFPQPSIFVNAISSLSATAAPMGLLALGGSIQMGKVMDCWKPTLSASIMKLLIFPAFFLPVAVWIGCRGELLTAMLVMLGSPSTVSCFTMARSMGHTGVLSSGVIMLTTVCSAFSFTLWLYILRSLALL